MQNTILKLDHVSKCYSVNENKVIAINDISLSINSGDFVSIVGPSGSGKTSLLNLIGTLDRPTTGNVIIDGENVTNYSVEELAVFRRKKIGFVFQFFNLVEGLTAWENVELPLVFDYTDLNKRQTIVDNLFEEFSLTHLKTKFPEELSSGERQRVAIMRSLANSPHLLLADEPTGNLDTKTGIEVLNLLKKLNEKKGMTILLVTHDESAAKVAKRIIHMRDGKIEKETTN